MLNEQKSIKDESVVARYIDDEERSYEIDTRGTAPNRLQIENQLKLEALEVRLQYPATDIELEVSKTFFNFLKENSLELREGIIRFFKIFPR